MTIYILTCINQNSELSFARAFRTKKEAQSNMKRSVESIRARFARNYGEHYVKVGNDGASVGNDSLCFIYNITEAEL